MFKKKTDVEISATINTKEDLEFVIECTKKLKKEFQIKGTLKVNVTFGQGY